MLIDSAAENLLRYLPTLIELVEYVGQRLLSIYQQTSPVATYYKPDQSPVTKADLLSHQFIIDALLLLTPHIPVLSEESLIINNTIRKHGKNIG